MAGAALCCPTRGVCVKNNVPLVLASTYAVNGVPKGQQKGLPLLQLQPGGRFTAFWTIFKYR